MPLGCGIIASPTSEEVGHPTKGLCGFEPISELLTRSMGPGICANATMESLNPAISTVIIGRKGRKENREGNCDANLYERSSRG